MVRKHRLAFFVLFGAVLAGCTGGGKPPGQAQSSATVPVTSGTGGALTVPVRPITSSTAPVTSAPGTPSPPSATVNTPTNAGAVVALDYALTDAGSDPCSVVVECSIDDGRTFAAATDAGAASGSHGASGLTSSPTGTAHLFAWDARRDLGANLRAFVRLRLTPSDASGQGQAVTTGTFTVDATARATRLLSLAIPLDPAGPDVLGDWMVLSTGTLLRPAVQPPATGGQGRQMTSSSGLVGTPRGDFVFAGHNASSAIDVYSVSPTGGLARIAGSPFPCAGAPMDIVVHPNGRFLYTVNFTSAGSKLEAFAIGPTGALTAVPGSPFDVGTSPRGLAIDPRGDFLYTGHMFGADLGVRAHKLDPATGIPTFSSALSLTGKASRPGKHVFVDPRGGLLFCSDLDNGIFAATIDPTTRALTLAPNMPLALGAFLSGGMTVTKRGDFLYVAFQASTGQVLQGYRVGQAGALTPVGGSPFSGVGANTLYLETDGTDQLLFVSSRVDDTVRVFQLDRTSGVPTQIAGSPFPDPTPGAIVGPLLPLP